MFDFASNMPTVVTILVMLILIGVGASIIADNTGLNPKLFGFIGVCAGLFIAYKLYIE